MHDHTGIETALIPIPAPMKLRSGANESIPIYPLTTNITAHNEKNTFLELLSIDMFHYTLYSLTGNEKQAIHCLLTHFPLIWHYIQVKFGTTDPMKDR
jgi:hypothetical protein